MSPFLKALARIAFGVAVGFVLLDLVLGAFLQRSGLLFDVVDIQSPATLFAKLDALRRFEGNRVVVLGDSLVYGRAMEDHGDANWRDHTLAESLQREIEATSPDLPTLVLNLGMNGLLPADLEQVLRLVVPLTPDLVVLDLSLRSFSADFEPQATRMSRPWLADMSIDANGRLRASDGVHSFLVNHWLLYRVRDFLQWRLFDGEPRAALARLRGRIDARLGGGGETGGPDELFVLLLKVKKRYHGVRLGPENPQLAALERSLSLLEATGTKTLIFYARESPSLLPRFADGEAYARELARLEQTVRRHTGANLVYRPPLETLESRHYVDHIHLTAEGYAVLARHLWSASAILRASHEQGNDL